jgi:transcriptional regulator with XRE-family HTH domain
VAVVSEEMLGARIRRLRVAREMTQPGLAAAMLELGARTEQRDISRYEGDVYEPKIRTFVALARALGVTVEMLLYGEDEAGRIADARTRR